MANGKTEEWKDTVARCVNGLVEIRPDALKVSEQERLFDLVFNLKCNFSGRALWQLGTENVKRFGGDSLQSCWQIAVDDPIKPFCFMFNESMLGGGVGFNITPEYVYALPKVKYNPIVRRTNSYDCNYIIPDNREGWVNILGKIMKAYFYTGKDVLYNTECIRPKGTLIKSFGGVASGSEELVAGFDSITKVISRRYNQKLRPIDCLDIMNIIGKIVVSGNVRRSAQLALGDINDTEFLNAKNWGAGSIPNWRTLSNNSAVCNHYDEITSDFWDNYDGEGEPYGLVNLNACRNYGRIVDGLNYRPDNNVVGLNPCAEITLESYEACNLADVFLPNIKDPDELFEATVLMYKVCKIISTLPFLHEETNKVVARNHRLGLSLNGFLQSRFRYDSALFDAVYGNLEQEDASFSRKLGVGTSIKLTTMKPSGTSSLLAGVTPGGHPAFAPYYIRRVRMAANDPLVDVCRKQGYHVEPELRLDGTNNLETMVVSFPIATPENTVCAAELSAVNQLDNLAWLQKHWADNSVSCTIYYNEEELPQIQRWLQENYEQVKTVSFLLKSEHGFKQSPMEEITEKTYNELKRTPIINIEESEERDLLDSVECTTGSCPIK
jgi:adenosylcobalamin-dependent ribonucleoside-triphosphate reductase